MSAMTSVFGSDGRAVGEGRIAAVTGATGVIGKRIVCRLLAAGWRVRVLTRRDLTPGAIECVKGDLGDKEALAKLLVDAEALFHCAAELRNPSRMWQVNVEGTRNVIEAASLTHIRYLCHLSSAGVVGNTDACVIDETTPCSPANSYEQSKWAAEVLVARGIEGCRVVILRPTNVVDEEQCGAMAILSCGVVNRLKLFFKGGERAHVVHADDVAAAALFLMRGEAFDHECYLVSLDHEEQNTYAGLRLLCEVQRGCASCRLPLCLPIGVVRALRTFLRGKRVRGDVRYSSAKLLSTGFAYEAGLSGTVARMAEVLR